MYVEVHMTWHLLVWFSLHPLHSEVAFYLCMQIALFVSSSDAVQPGWLLTYLRNISPAQIEEMRQNLAKVCGCNIVVNVIILMLLFCILSNVVLGTFIYRFCVLGFWIGET